MTIEVRQIVIRCVVNDRPPRASEPPIPRADLQRAREQVLAECKAWLAEQLRAPQER